MVQDILTLPGTGGLRVQGFSHRENLRCLPSGKCHGTNNGSFFAEEIPKVKTRKRFYHGKDAAA
jgi:hypothetical protein